MQHVKIECRYCQPDSAQKAGQAIVPDWQAHPAWIAGFEALNAYGNWVSSVVLPIAFQWIEEHKDEVYASVPAELRDDIGVVIGAAFRLLQQQPGFSTTVERNGELAGKALDTSKLNPLWTGMTEKLRASSQAIFAEQESLL